MASRKLRENEDSLPFAALQLLAPPVRLVSAALWKVMKQRDVMQYGVVEEFVTSACETVPGLLTLRHQGKLALGLRGRLILELCCKQPDEKVIERQLERICVPTAPTNSSAPPMRTDVKIVKTVENFHALVHTLLTDPEVKEKFFEEEFPVEYGPIFDQELEKLLWEFLIRLDQLLPVPNLSQTVSWLSNAPPVLEECVHAAIQPKLLKILLQHQTCLGHLDPAASLPPNMGECVLASLSLQPSGRVLSNQPNGKSSTGQSYDTVTKKKKKILTPVFGLISNDDVPIMSSARKKKQGSVEPTSSVQITTVDSKQREKSNFINTKQKSNDGLKEGKESVEEKNQSERISRVKRKQPSDVEEEVGSIMRSGRNIVKRSNRDEDDNRATEADVGTLRFPQDLTLHSIVGSCLASQPRVVIEKMSLSPGHTNSDPQREREGSTHDQQQSESSPVTSPASRTLSHQLQKLDSDNSDMDDKENHPALSSLSSSSSRQRNHAETSASPGDGDDYVADSEDEATKNFKGRLFLKRYCKTKHGTFVPTLREFWKPSMASRNLSLNSKRR